MDTTARRRGTMAEEEVNLSGVQDVPEPYSSSTQRKALQAIRLGRVTLSKRIGENILTAECSSSTSPDTFWHPAAQYDDDGEVIGVTCDCPNGTKGALRARCWHACALERLITQIRN